MYRANRICPPGVHFVPFWIMFKVPGTQISYLNNSASRAFMSLFNQVHLPPNTPLNLKGGQKMVICRVTMLRLVGSRIHKCSFEACHRTNGAGGKRKKNVL